MKIYRLSLASGILFLLALLLVGLPVSAMAQCGGSGSGYMHNQHMGSSGHMGYGQTGIYGNQAPVPTDPNAGASGYGAWTAPDYGYAEPQNSDASGQMMSHGQAGSGHMGHRGQ